MRLIVAICVSLLALSLPSCCRGALTTDEKTAFIKCHNHERSFATLEVKPGQLLGDVLWDDKLAEHAQAYIDTCHTCCDGPSGLRHQSASDRRDVASSCPVSLTKTHREVGESIAWGKLPLTVPQACNLWASQKGDYNAATGECAEGKVCSHYKQMVWDSSRYIGCGSRSCNGSITYVCQYGPEGNLLGQRPYQPCLGSGCTDPRPAVAIESSSTCRWDMNYVPPVGEESGSARGALPTLLAGALCLSVALFA